MTNGLTYPLGLVSELPTPESLLSLQGDLSPPFESVFPSFSFELSTEVGERLPSPVSESWWWRAESKLGEERGDGTGELNGVERCDPAGDDT